MYSADIHFPALRELAKKIRIHVLQMTSNGGSSHIGSAFSMADIVAVLYGSILRIDPTNPECTDRDRFILSKGHAGAAVYAALAEKGFFDKGWLQTHYKNGSKLSGHISHKGIPGVEMSTGSLGHGLPVATGMAIAAKRKKEQHRVFVLLGDGECDEGSNWEAALFASHHRLSNLTVLIDYNKLQSLDSIEQTLALEPLADKWHSFGWDVEEVDGHDVTSLSNTLDTLSPSHKPRCLICHTVKGKGVSFMENSVLWHYRTARGEEYRAALDELTSAA
ncbi:transketolase [Pirellulales bacterium]|nr:transketolase [Pirellulales bacterium]